MQDSEWTGQITSYSFENGSIQNEWLQGGKPKCKPQQISKPEDAFFGTGLPYNKEPEKQD